MGVVITRDDIVAYAEVDYIIKHMEEKYINKIPEKMLVFFEEIKDPGHIVNINPYVPLQSQGLKKYTLEIIALLHLKYWCEDEARKKELYNLMLRNQEKLEEQIREKFSINNLFDDNSVKKVKDEHDLENDFSKPRVVQYYNQYTKDNDDIQDYTDLKEVDDSENLNYEEKMPRKVEENEGIKNSINNFIKKIINFFNKK